ncbi:MULTISPECIES: hypothetical protein [unclassified Imperialibacter]|uniref:hypothetical protein n=1 Tax=unclassified Imperialibacter TaxID=2629706 RepID=UPI001251AA4E|nr:MULTISPECIES: hypothetical protein [unclassified Imperialibacter]CAD5270482.1 hypothetical protein IMPERIA89_340422 [Imperialibacter sp. 89]CAD5298252.1 hypothetical protein IMPERIA75_700421 [Imperialibacter sp. 75]VVT34837.1 hypothetical protein IMPR6_700016 [Imperialibacter sp. EC-SDR9]
MKKYDIRIRRGAFHEKRTSRYKNFDQLSRRYKKERIKQVMTRLFYLLFLVAVSVALFFLFR